MRWTQTVIPTSKEDPADAVIISHKLMLRAGLIRQLAAGAFDFLPLGLRSLHKAAAIVREEMNAIGCAEVLLPAIQPMDLWRQTGRDQSYGENLFKLKDRHGQTMVLGPTHEEVVTELVRACVDSYKQLPVSLFQIQTKFRDEYRPRFGLLRVREFLMKDAYSFHATPESLEQTYRQFYGAYERIMKRCGIEHLAVEAESGPIGGGASHEFMVVSDAGEDTIVRSDKGNYAANLERAAIGARSWSFGEQPSEELKKIHTPGLPGIVEVAAFLKVEPKRMLKTLVFRVEQPKDGGRLSLARYSGRGQPVVSAVEPGEGSSEAGAPAPSQQSPHPNPLPLSTAGEGESRPENLAHPKWLVAVVRGDHDVNEAKLARAAKEQFHIERFVLEDTPQVRQSWTIGFVGPDAAVRNIEAVMVVDPDAATGASWAAGANEADHHVIGFNWFRECGDKLADPRKVAVADIRDAIDGDPSPLDDGGVLKMSRGIEIGHVFKLGTKYSDAQGATFLDDKGVAHPLLMGCYGIGIARLLVAAVEALHDDRGIVWPTALAPSSVVITPIQYTGETKRVADELYVQLRAAGIDVLLDDRVDVRPGARFADADLIGIPVRINIGERGLKQASVEVKRRTDAQPEMVPIASAVQHIQRMLADRK